MDGFVLLMAIALTAVALPLALKFGPEPKPWVCGVCKARYATQAEVIKHEQTMHGLEPNELPPLW